MTTTSQPPTITDEQNERLLKLQWADLLLKLSDDRATSAQAELDENLEVFEQGVQGENMARYRCTIRIAHIDYWRAVASGEHVPHAEQYRK